MNVSGRIVKTSCFETNVVFNCFVVIHSFLLVISLLKMMDDSRFLHSISCRVFISENSV